MTRLYDSLAIYTVYFNPKDYPGEYVVRCWRVNANLTEPAADQNLFARGPTLAGVRKLAPPGLTVLLRDRNDDPNIVESWL